MSVEGDILYRGPVVQSPQEDATPEASPSIMMRNLLASVGEGIRAKFGPAAEQILQHHCLAVAFTPAMDIKGRLKFQKVCPYRVISPIVAV